MVSDIIRVRDIDFVMLSFDEPNADENFEDLRTFVPKAKRSHGVKGFDAAHIAAANKSETEVFATVDADNIVDPNVLDLKLYNPQHKETFAVSLNGINYTNGLVYGNGSIKIWTKSFIYNMHSHENNTKEIGTGISEKNAVDFCFNENYFSTSNTCFSCTVTNGSEYQSWRSGFREGLKKGIQHKESLANKFNNECQYLDSINIQQMIIWGSVGADIMYGNIGADAAVAGMMLYFGNLIPITLINDYVWLEEFYRTEWPKWKALVPEMRKSLGHMLNIPEVSLLSPVESKMLKKYMSYQLKLGLSANRRYDLEIKSE